MYPAYVHKLNSLYLRDEHIHSRLSHIPQFLYRDDNMLYIHYTQVQTTNYRENHCHGVHIE